ncbi:thiol:disulfide interchange protein DsbD [Polaromonas sp. YR568]|uniref:protein-disulfide reductase DsbD family protein n=1 Tax=Polaromonas sp. YR568 TaxID=1855301 RepID=UPI0008E5B64F|nr:thioredoxin family protein [Polaromonas sp. YR568]SFU99284.1 thiol:disulfide interchange protein DsbD [Polaromonas sp. YR568]
MHFKRFLPVPSALPAVAAATFLIAAYALPTGANAQNTAFNLPGKSQGAAAAVVTTEQVRAELLAWAPQGVEPGQPVWVGLKLTHQPEWHTYWKNSGDSGLPTELSWQLPAGITVGDIAWPTPKKIPIGTLANYGYEKTVLLPVPLTVAPGFSATQLMVKLKAAWLICRKECIPQEGDFSLTIPVKSSTAASGELFEQTFKATPKSLPAGASQVEVAGKAIQVSLAGLPAALQGKTLEFYPETGSVIEPAAAWQQAWQGAVWTATVPLSAQRTESPASMPLVVAAGETAYRIDAPVKGPWPAAAPIATVSPALEAALRANAAAGAAPAPSNAPPLGLLAALLGALLGGLILNLMPCVFPVLAIKVVGFVHVKDQATRVTTGLAYTLGVVLSFLALGALLLGLRVAGQQLGWGFHLQSPAVVAVLAALFTLLGLNLAGLFEFGNFLPGRVAGWQAKNPTVNAFLSGVLATAIASPCTAPFMGASLGYAIGLPALEALAIFAAIGIGMALPYLAASVIPAVARALPRPGPWMVTFKQLMAFPMFATVAWLVWVLGQQSGIDGAGALLALLVLMALAIWAFTLRGTARTLIASFSIALCALGIWAIGPNITKPVVDTPTAAAEAPGGWQAWAPGRVDQLAAQGQSVFVDFTAAWCVTCQYNKKTTLSDASVLADVKAKNVALLRADWTRRDPAVTAALAQLGRSGVPVYVIYKPGRAPVVLSEILSVDDVRAELAKL